ncbi:hypothetical protein EGI26_06795, partial [Lacihabitans sp. CCS-44]|nr:hypothetical protein [Lacihabitans sp. CCS-44]
MVEITGVTGDGLVPIVIVFEFPDVPQLVVHVAVYVHHVIVPSEQPVAVSVAFSAPQTIVLLVEITGVTGDGLV